MFVCRYLFGLILIDCMYTSNNITEFFNLIALNPNPPSSALTKLRSHTYERILQIKQPKGLRLNFVSCHKLIILSLAAKSLMNQISSISPFYQYC